jgi:Tol biopolymer transport system component
MTEDSLRSEPDTPTGFRQFRDRGFAQAKLPWQRQTALLGILAILLAVYIAYLLRPPVAPPYVSRFIPVTATGRAKYVPLLPDDRNIYFLELVSGHQALASVPTAGGEVTLVPVSLENLQLADISASGQELLVGSRLGTRANWPLWKLSINQNMSATRLGTIESSSATWSPDGRQMVYSSGHELFLAQADGSQPRLLATAPGVARWFRWSPDSEVIRFTVLSSQNRTTSLWEVSLSGKNLRPLLAGWSDPSWECCGSWTADGTFYVFQATRENSSQIWAIREKASPLQKNDRKPVQLTNGPLSYRGPVPSRDGRRIFVVGDSKRSELLRYNAASKRFDPYLGGISAESVDFSRDGQWVAYVSYPEGVLWRCRIDGSETKRLSPPSMHVYLPRWSPDGTRLAFRAEKVNQPVKIYTVSPDGANFTRLFADERSEADPSWSPDGKQLVFGRLTLPYEPQAKAIHLYDFESKRLDTLPASEGLFSPRWSPDGRYLAALSLNSQRLMLFEFQSKRWELLAEINASYPTWSPDSKYLYIGAIRENKQSQYRVRIADKKLERVLSVPDVLQEAISFALWYGMAPDGSTLVARDLSTQEIYALEWEIP